MVERNTSVFCVGRVLKLLSVCSSLVLVLLLLAGCGSQTVIVHGLDEREANEILTYLNGRSIKAEKVAAVAAGGGANAAPKWNITVDSIDANEAMGVLNAVGLPRRPEENLLGIFTNSGLVPSDTQEQIRYQAGLASQLSSVIRKFDGVIDADVQLSFPKEDPLNPQASKNLVSAAVYVKHNGVLDDPNSHLESKIRRLVANSVPNLLYDNVTVVGERTRGGETGFESGEGESASQEKALVSVWSMIIAKESLTRFRVVFFSFFVAILILLVFIAWLLWKLLPVLSSSGGVSQLFTFHSLAIKDAGEAAKDATAAKEGEAKKGDSGKVANPAESVKGKAPETTPAEQAEDLDEEVEEGEGEEADEGTERR